MGPKVDLKIDIPAADSKKDETTDVLPKLPRITSKLYWGCSETIPAGQPLVSSSSEIPESANNANNGKKEDENTEPDKSYAYWPGTGSKSIPDGASAAGKYKLNTNYCGETEVTLSPEQDFLPPIKLIEPAKADLNKAIRLKWKEVKNARGYLLMAYGGNEKESITWTSSADPNAPASIQYRAISEKQMADYIKKGIILPPNTTTCVIPEGIFKNSDSVMLSFTAFGADSIQDKDGIQTQVVVRSNASILLGGMDIEE